MTDQLDNLKYFFEDDDEQWESLIDFTDIEKDGVSLDNLLTYFQS